MDPSTKGESSDSHGASNGSQNESKLELFGFDSLVNILGLKSMTGEQIPAPSSPRDGEDVAITLGQPKGGGPYYLIGRALGPEVGVSIGLCFFLGNAVAGALLETIRVHEFWFLGILQDRSCSMVPVLRWRNFVGTLSLDGLGFYRYRFRYVLGAVETFLDAIPAAGFFKGAALQSLTGAPRLLAAIANDDILPVLKYFRVTEGVIMFLISWFFTVVSLALASLIYYYVSLKGKAGDWGDGFKSAYFQLALRSLRSLGANQVHPKNWYPIPLILCRPWGKLPENVPCHPKLADFANCVKKKGRGMSIFVSTIDGDYHELAEDAKTACRQLSAYIDYKHCEGVAEIIVAPDMSDGFRGIVQTMGLGNLKPNIVVMRYPEIWRRENLTQIPSTFVSIINDCIIANKAVVIVKGLDEWPGEYQKQYGTIDLYWIVRDGGLMLLLSQLLLTKESFESCKIQVFCIAEEDMEAEELKADVKKFLYDLRMQAEVIVVTMKSWEAHVESGAQQDDSLEAFTSAQRRIASYLAEMKETARREGNPLMADGRPVVVNEQQVDKFLYTTLKLNSTILRYSRMAAVVLVSLPPPPLNHPAYFYMEYMDLLVENVPRMLIVRGYRRDVVTLFT
ncbi:hypothetical protein COCNU_scaffold002878G000020 [Cocos nucifera]|nr:hypothetical protein [Cocos nucifera]